LLEGHSLFGLNPPTFTLDECINQSVWRSQWGAHNDFPIMLDKNGNGFSSGPDDLINTCGHARKYIKQPAVESEE
jgi:hypothetical protein